MERIREAAELCLEVQGGAVEQLEFVGLQKISIGIPMAAAASCPRIPAKR